MANPSAHPPEPPPQDGRIAAEGAEHSAADGPTQPSHTAPAFSPLYQQIKTLILRSLQAGEWKPGDMIPSEFDLAARFRVSQGTVRKAIDELATDNLLVRRQGKGTYVATHAEQHIQYRFLRLLPDTGDLAGQGPAERRIIECRRLRASAEVARQLALRTGDPILQVKRVLAFAGTPAILEDLWLPGGPFKGLTLETLSEDKGPMYALFETQFGVRMVRATEKIKAVSADADAARLLGVPEGHPLLSVERLACTYNDVPMELRRGLYRTESRHYRNELS
ncbi:MAG: GntR family transcriptional regulator [Hydrogenophaga sp.]|jgi:GntR family transcriptional regulator|uniref:GntR family transcriptional regulator n=1 Tax=Hydrogenophaga sp. TaxID=1904254 RepID=UPI00272670C7|nr:GntR family transcriptional regulator [Hydrogenophaga sp.]MDO9482391.1 GntR family transcriptional regulator [Hydrogenophaga sp.]MDP2094402.1 GntR family transcriptional regulator [Hydrogenophaga sp.]MDP3344297.1 GntR family transcriptional regulator [Hydrogenophaga sp.]MDP3805907.1 GntR family transcriptional regulator [Hydrogenophaga sp.]MDP3923623.1 GntR family transcriptional regulator [Hydrogenophaga sp.]